MRQINQVPVVFATRSLNGPNSFFSDDSLAPTWWTACCNTFCEFRVETVLSWTRWTRWNHLYPSVSSSTQAKPLPRTTVGETKAALDISGETASHRILRRVNPTNRELEVELHRPLHIFQSQLVK
jgi:hypothetical protein